jgi:hypothetical protein
MKIIQKFSLAAIIAAFTASAWAFPYTQPHYGPPPANEPPNAVVVITRALSDRTIGVFVQGRGVGTSTSTSNLPDNRYRPNWSGKVTLHGWD